MSLVLVVADSLRHDAPGFAGGPARTPTLDHLAGQGIFFERAHSCSPWTVPSIAAMLTGVYAHRLGLAKWEQPWPESHPSLFDLARRLGLTVASFVFDTTHLFRRVPAAGVAGSSQDLASLRSWLRQHRGRPFVLFVHYWWTHVPYVDKPMSIKAWKQTTDEVLAAVRQSDRAKQGARQLYYRAVERFSDHWLPALLEEIDLDRTWLAITADHGESWGERPETAALSDVFDLHGNTLYDEVLRVPLVLRPPGGCSGRRIGELVRTVDLAPTLAELLALEATDQWRDADGISLAAVVRDGERPKKLESVAVANRDVVDTAKLPAESNKLWTAYSLTTQRYKQIWYPEEDRFVAFDLLADPREESPLPDPKAPPLEQGWQRLRQEQARARVGELLPEDAARLEERLRQLGYLD
jgi:arylsulfatase A-like enzyme